MKKTIMPSLRRVIVPLLYGYNSHTALDAALALAAEILLVGMVVVTKEEELSAGAKQARDADATTFDAG